MVVIWLLSTRLIKPSFHFPLSHRRSTTVSLKSRNLFKLFTARQNGGERNWTLNYADRSAFSLIPCKMKCWQIDERLSFFLEGSTLRHDQASYKIFGLLYRLQNASARGNFQKIVSYGIARRLLFRQVNTAPLVTSKSSTNQNTTRTTHNDSVRQQVLLATKSTDSLIHPMDDDSQR